MATSNKTTLLKKLMDMFSFYAVALIGVALLFTRLHIAGLAAPLDLIAFFLSVLVVAVYSFFYAIRKGQTTLSLTIHLLIWGVAVTLIVLFRIMNYHG